MELSEYIKDTLISVVKGIEESQTALTESGSTAIINPSFTSTSEPKFLNTTTGRRMVQEVSFTIGVTIEGESGSEGGAGVKLSVLSIGGKATNKRSETEVNTISFTVPVCFPINDNLTRTGAKASFAI